MATIDSLNVSYKKLNVINTINYWAQLFSVAVSFAGYWFSQETCFILISIAVILAYCITSITSEIFANILGNRRLVNAVEDGFEKKINSDAYTEKYYNNTFPGGIDKFNLDLFESVFFTYHIFNKQAVRSYFATVVCMLAAVYAIIFTEPVFSVQVLEIAFGGNAFIKIVKTIYFHLILARIYGDFDKVYVAKEHVLHCHYLLSLSIKYERIKAYYGLSLDSKLFEKMNEELTMKWDEYVRKICDNPQNQQDYPHQA